MTQAEVATVAGHRIQCADCGGHGIVTYWSFGVKEPDECGWCFGSGSNWQYPSGLIAKHYAGPLIGRAHLESKP